MLLCQVSTSWSRWEVLSSIVLILDNIRLCDTTLRESNSVPVALLVVQISLLSLLRSATSQWCSGWTGRGEDGPLWCPGVADHLDRDTATTNIVIFLSGNRESRTREKHPPASLSAYHPGGSARWRWIHWKSQKRDPHSAARLVQMGVDTMMASSALRRGC